ncbi:hypothetical protein SLS56_012140 [Neofusicoccum ribis]|uniref:Transcription factor domain-containing protein n=1 Tax=Neofusicoccum ribis TaxID=45134 RepID=A0ABR3SAP0_9PEZI
MSPSFLQSDSSQLGVDRARVPLHPSIQRGVAGLGLGGGLAVEAASSLESLVWGSHQAATPGELEANADISSATDLTVKMWVILSGLQRPSIDKDVQISLYYMNEEHYQILGIGNGKSLSRIFYRKALDTLGSIDFMAIHSAWRRDAKRIIVLLSSANCIAQMMQLHLLGPNPTSPYSLEDVVDREVKKRVWSYLVIQDSYLITFKRAYSIYLGHATTPPPANCSEVAEEMEHDLPMSRPTQSSYMIFQTRMTGVKRWLHDQICQLEAKYLPLDEVYQKVLRADADMKKLHHDLPQWMKTISNAQSLDSARNQRINFRISFAHMKLSIHRAFFCRGFTDKRYWYSHVTCLGAARLLLQTFRESVGEGFVEIWTVPAHAISACIIITLNLLFIDDEDGFDCEVTHSASDDHQSMSECLRILNASDRPNQLVKRGMIMIDRLLQQKELRTSTYQSFNSEEVARLVKEVEDILRLDTQMLPSAVNSTFDELLGLLDEYPMCAGYEL